MFLAPPQKKNLVVLVLVVALVLLVLLVVFILIVVLFFLFFLLFLFFFDLVLLVVLVALFFFSCSWFFLCSVVPQVRRDAVDQAKQFKTARGHDMEAPAAGPAVEVEEDDTGARGSMDPPPLFPAPVPEGSVATLKGKAKVKATRARAKAKALETAEPKFFGFRSWLSWLQAASQTWHPGGVG